MQRLINSAFVTVLLGLLLSLTIQAQTATHKTPFDFDGDDKTDLTVWRPDSSIWYIFQSTNNTARIENFGIKTDKLVPGDYDGDGKTDIAVFRLDTSTWYVSQSSNNAFVYTNFGSIGDIPVPADYDGDGTTDKAVFRPSDSIWYILQSSNGQVKTVALGDSTIDLTVRGDFDGDGKSDPAVWRPSTGVWYYIKSLNNPNNDVTAIQFGLGSLGDSVGAGDYDNDGTTDIAVWRSTTGVWYVLQSSDSNVVTYQFGSGSNGDVPVPGDYDGDGKSDYAVWRAPTGVWYINKSQTNTLQATQWGSQGAGDKLAPAAFIPTGSIVGNIGKSNDVTPISGALVEIYQQGEFKAAVVSDGFGNFSASGLLTGSYEVRVSAVNYKDARFRDISVIAGGTTTNNVVLSSDESNLYTDNFNDNSISSANWVSGLLPNSPNTGTEIQVAEVNSQLEITIPATTSPGTRFNGLRTAQAQNFNDTSTVVRVIESPVSDNRDASGKSITKARLEVGEDDQFKYYFEIIGGQVFARKNIDDSTTNIGNFPFSPINTPYLRIRNSVADERVYYESSSTGLDGTWKNEFEDFYGGTPPFDFSNVFVSANAGREGPTCDPGECTVDPKAVLDDFRFVKHSDLIAKAGEDQIITVGTNPQLTGTATDQSGNSATASTYKWTFSSKPSGAPDPTISSPDSASTTISGINFIGVYNFQLTVSDGSAGYSTDTVRIFVDAVPVAQINAPSSIIEDEPIVFDGTLSSGADSYEWDFGSGHKAIIGRATHVFMKPGTYNVTLKVTNKAGVVSSIANHTVVVNPLPSATTTVTHNCDGVNDVSELQGFVTNAVGRTDIVLPNGCEIDFSEQTLVLPYKSSNDYIVIRSAGASLLTEGVRVSKDNSNQTANMATLKSNGHSNAQIIETGDASPFGVHHYRFDGIYFSRGDANLPEEDRQILTRIIKLGEPNQSLPDVEQFLYQVAHHLVFNHCIVENVGDSATRKGIEANAADVSILNSSIYNIRGNAGDSYAIGAWSTPGRHAIVNNRIEGGSENIIYGGASPAIKNVSPRDLTIRGNNLFKPLEWLPIDKPLCVDPEDPNGPLVGCIWKPNAKNIFEIKHAQNLIFDGNNLENSWVGADQTASGILLRSEDDNGLAPWSETRDVQVTNNRMYNTGNGISLSGKDNANPVVPMSNVVVRNNLFDRIGFIVNPDGTKTDGRLILLVDPGKRWTIDHNTFVNDLSSPLDDNPDRAIGIQFSNVLLTNDSEFRFTNNMFKLNDLGFRGESQAAGGINGLFILNAYVPDWIMRRNVFLLSDSGICGGFTAPLVCNNYPSDNKYDLNPSDTTFQNQFVDYDNGNYTLVPGSLGFQYATDGNDVGVDFPTVSTASGKAINGTWDIP